MMIKYQLLVLCFFANFYFAQAPIGAKAPNSYIYDIGLANSQNYGGIKIPVKKAYEMWSKYEYLKSNGVSTPIPAGVQTHQFTGKMFQDWFKMYKLKVQQIQAIQKL